MSSENSKAVPDERQTASLPGSEASASSALAVIDRMKSALGIEKDTDLAQRLGIPKTTVSSWKQRGSIPYAECVQISVAERISLDWLLTGREQTGMSKGMYDIGIDIELMSILHYYAEKSFPLKEEKYDWEQSRFRTRYAIQLYARYKDVLDKETKEKGVDRNVFLDHLKTSLLILTDVEKEAE